MKQEKREKKETLIKIFEKINKRFFPKLKNTNTNNLPFIIAFSGVPGSGKTTISKILEKKYKGVRIDNDELRDIISDFSGNYKLTKKDKEIIIKIFKFSKKIYIKEMYDFSENMIKNEVILYKYQKWFLENYPFKNKLLILDSSIDRKYEMLLKILRKKMFKIFIIKLPFNKEMFLRRERKRNKDTSFFLKNIGRWKRDYDNLNKNVKVNFVFSNNLNELFVELNKYLTNQFFNKIFEFSHTSFFSFSYSIS